MDLVFVNPERRVEETLEVLREQLSRREERAANMQEDIEDMQKQAVKSRNEIQQRSLLRRICTTKQYMAQVFGEIEQINDALNKFELLRMKLDNYANIADQSEFLVDLAKHMQGAEATATAGEVAMDGLIGPDAPMPVAMEVSDADLDTERALALARSMPSAPSHTPAPPKRYVLPDGIPESES